MVVTAPRTLEDALLAHAFRRLYVTVSTGRLFDSAAEPEAGSVYVSADLGGVKAESDGE